MFEGGFGGFGDFGGMGTMTSPWDFGTGFQVPQSFVPGAMNQPVAPPVDLAKDMAMGLAQSGIRPGQFMANPAIAAPVLAPPVTPTMNNAWDATPVSMPGGPKVDLPDQQPMSAPAAANPNVQADEATEASAGGTPGEAKKAGEKTMAERLTESLKGVRPPTPPTPQTVRTPAAPQLGAIKSGELLALLAALGQGGGQAGAGGLKVTPTLGATMKGMY